MVAPEANNSKVDYKGFKRLLSLQNEINQLLRQMFLNEHGEMDEDSSGKHAYIPPIDIYDDGKSYKIIVELPGLKPGDVEINIENGFLELKGARTKKNKVENYMIHETCFGSFCRSFPLPDNVNIEKKCKANFANGILTIDLPKFSSSKLKQRKFSIKLK